MPSRCRGGMAEERSNPQPMMNGMEKSDSVIVAVKSANKGTPVPAEPMEPRTEPKGNPKSQSMRRTQDRESVSQAADRIRQFVQREPGVRLTALLHHITVDALRWACQSASKIDPLSACNIDPLSGTAEVVPVVNRGDPSGFV